MESSERLQKIATMVKSGGISKETAILIADELFELNQTISNLNDLKNESMQSLDHHHTEIKNLTKQIERLKMDLEVENAYREKYQTEYIRLTLENQALKDEVYKLLKYCETT